MKRTFAAAAALSGTVCFGILWLNNLISARRYYALLLRGEYTDRFPPGFAPLLDWSTVDVSTVTTFIPFFGFVLILYRIFRPAEDPGCPFFPGYDRFNLALGLLGTIWGIILVGYYPAEQITIAALMRCLHTAMFSTLVAVAWVMVLMPAAVLPLLRSCRGSGPEDEPELDRLIGRISAGLAGGIGALPRRTGRNRRRAPRTAAECRRRARGRNRLAEERRRNAERAGGGNPQARPPPAAAPGGKRPALRRERRAEPPADRQRRHDPGAPADHRTNPQRIEVTPWLPDSLTGRVRSC